MKHQLFLFDLDDTLLDFRASERLTFARVLEDFGVRDDLDLLFRDYQEINHALWRGFELKQVSKEFLKVERFRATFAKHRLEIDAGVASDRYLDTLAETVVLVDGALEVCAALAAEGEIGIITNGIESIQARRIRTSGLSDYIAFVATSEASGFAKPDSRFFEFTVGKAKAFAKPSSLIVGDRLDADILGANQFGIDSCWFNPHRAANETQAKPTFEVDHLDQIVPWLRAAGSEG